MDQLDEQRPQIVDESRYRILVEAVTDYAIYMLDPDGLIVSWNAGARRLKGYEAQEVLGESFAKFYPEEDRKAGQPQRTLDTAAREGRFEGEGWRSRKDGARFWAHVVVDPILDDDGVLIGFAKITRDLTERRIAEEALKRSEERFRLLVQGVNDYAIYMLDPEGRVTNWNVGAQKIKGYAPEEIIGQHFSRFYTEEDRASGLPQIGLETALKEGRFEKEGLRVRKDGRTFWANVVIDPIRDERGELLGFAKVTRDISEKREAQQALERTREAFFQSQKMEAIGQLTGGVAHDFNNLLMAILGSLDLLRKRLPDNPPAKRLLETATLAAQRGASLTRRMLAFARRQELILERLDLPALVGGLTELLERPLGGAAALEVSFPERLPAVMADANQLELALLNLVVNARDAMPDGGRILISAVLESVGDGHASHLPPGRYVRLAVADDGMGMDEETLARATEPFFTTKGVGKGTGLGLSMAHGAAEQSGGRLTLRSRKGEGTTVELWLPVADGPAAASVPPPDAQEVAADAVGSLRVLVVDDDPLVLSSTADMLEDLGYEALRAESGAAALEILRVGSAVDVVITDQVMPHMTGTQLAEAIRAERPSLAVILASGFSELPPGFDLALSRLAKPFRQDSLQAAILATRRAAATEG